MPTFSSGKLYRYYSCSGEYKDFVREVIVDNKLYFNSPKQFNDPFDCKIDGLTFDTNSTMDYFLEKNTYEIPREALALLLINNHRDILARCNNAIADLQNMVNERFSV